MNKAGRFINSYLWLVLLAAALLVLGVSLAFNRETDYTSRAAARTSRQIAARMAMLEGYMAEVASLESDTWPSLKGFPEDMVVYRYEDDSLRSWCNQFTLDNDDISRRSYIQRIRNLRFNLVSPLTDVDTSVSYLNMGPKWYLVKGMTGPGGCWVIGGLEVKHSYDGRIGNGVNPHLGLPDRFVINPISYSGGVPVKVKGRPMIKIIRENVGVIPLLPHPTALWLALFLIVAGALSILRRHPLPWVTGTVMAGLTIVLGLFYLLGHGMRNVSELFSPNVYADGPVLYSLGAALIIAVWVVSMVTCLFMGRAALLRIAVRNTFGKVLYISLIVLAFAGVAVYTHLSFKSIILNSNIVLELYRITSLTRFTVYVYLAGMSLLMSLALLLQMAAPLILRWTGLRIDIFSRWSRIVLSSLAAVYLVATSSLLGFRREESRIGIWANRLAIDRNLALELQLRGVERAIESDPVISDLIMGKKDYRIINDRITENYLGRIVQDYDVVMYMSGDNDGDPSALRFFNERLRSGTAIADSSRFFYSRSVGGKAQYTGLFVYYTPPEGVTRLFLGIESKADKVGRGYSSILGDSGPGSIVVPQRYSYGKYLDDKLVSYQGDYAYPTVLSGRLLSSNEGSSGSGFIGTDKYIHFVTRVSDEETIVISRPNENVTRYLVAGFLVAIAAYLGISLGSLRRRPRKVFDRNYYKSRINTVLYLSLIATLVTMAVISVLFVYRRNESNVMNLMTGKIGTIQSLVEASARYYSSRQDFNTQEFSGTLENIASYTKSDISLYTTSGRVFKSTYPQAFERMMLGSRLDEDAYQSIMYRNLRYYIHKEKFASHTFYSMYAPVFNGEGRMLAIISAPYTDSGLDFRSEALFHTVFIITVFLLLLLITRFLTAKVVDNMFRPLTEMGEKMNSARTDGLEYIIYEREDEISALVRAYNLMVHDLSESSKQMAQVERDKAWSEMARQVAHEIKNPLTPIKLQIQRIIRLKGKNDPQWEEKFDAMVPVILESIDGLTDTANEFSTFAKLYSEEPVTIDLDTLLSDQVALFDDKEDISFHYMGLKGALVQGPKPQLTRVFVNLLTNAVQALDGEGRHGEILVSLRNSARDGFYDIVFEDNGPGVRDENRSRLFTPNFTTKSSGTGLGLAICKNIIERCGGDISYSRSFSLGGACFTIRLPKK
ncbi:MAG: hypothetical protein IJ795_05780 [Bacteroidales bacterium]|nr:hypothetical protein [Bacteroidales bacterium]